MPQPCHRRAESLERGPKIEIPDGAEIRGQDGREASIRAAQGQRRENCRQESGAGQAGRAQRRRRAGGPKRARHETRQGQKHLRQDQENHQDQGQEQAHRD